MAFSGRLPVARKEAKDQPGGRATADTPQCKVHARHVRKAYIRPEIQFFMVWALKRPILHNRAKFRENLSIPCCDIAIYVVFKMTTAVILIFFKFEILTVYPLRGQSASPRQILSKSVKRLRRYGDLTVFKMAAVRHLGLWKYNF